MWRWRYSEQQFTKPIGAPIQAFAINPILPVEETITIYENDAGELYTADDGSFYITG